MITYRTATTADTAAIAGLHAQSWQLHYRGMMDDRYLDEDIEEERLQVWRERMSRADPKRYIVLAEEQGQLCGFACVFLDHDPQWGALLDNLHVLPDWQSRGVGRELMRRIARWVREERPDTTLYLTVLAGNKRAIAAYEAYRGKRMQTFPWPVPYDREEPVHLYLWDDWEVLLGKG